MDATQAPQAFPAEMDASKPIRTIRTSKFIPRIFLDHPELIALDPGVLCGYDPDDEATEPVAETDEGRSR
jgi:hypothetical protein